MKLETIMEYDSKYYMNTFGKRTPVCFEYGSGINLWDTEGKKYTDFLSGIAVNSLGHSHPALVGAIKSQAEKLIHCSSLYYIEQQALLAKALVENSFANRVFFANSGAEANEGAIKLARLYYKKQGAEDKYEIITLKRSFHGRTLTTLAATGQEKYRKPFEPLPQGFLSVEANNITDMENAISEKTCAVMIELIQGEGGVYPLDKEYVKKVRELCSLKGCLLVLDEIQTGIGRTGKLFGYEHYNIEPDIITLAKGLGGGMPIGAILAGKSVSDTFGPGEHGTTFGGGPLACAAALAVINTIKKDSLCKNAEEMGHYIKTGLDKLKSRHPIIEEIRSLGLMTGISLSKPEALRVKNECFEKGCLVGTIGESIIRLLPPLIVNRENIDFIITLLDGILYEFNN